MNEKFRSESYRVVLWMPGEIYTKFWEQKEATASSELRSETTEGGLWNLIPAAMEHGLVNCYLWSWKMSYYNKTFNNVAVTVTRLFPNSDHVTPL